MMASRLLAPEERHPFSFRSHNWAAQPLPGYETVLNGLRATSTAAELKLRAESEVGVGQESYRRRS